MKYTITYISGSPVQHRPGIANVSVTRTGLKLFGNVISWDAIRKSSIEYQTKESSVSAGKAVAGAVLAGGVGAIVGGMMGGVKVTVVLKVDYLLGSQEEQLVMYGNAGEKINKIINGKIQRNAQVIDAQPVITAKTEQRSALSKFVYWYFALYRYSYRVIKKLLKRKT